MSERTYYQSHECDGYRAKVTIEWSFPKTVDADLLPAYRRQTTEDIASAILSFSGPRMRDMVQTMRGYSISQETQGRWEDRRVNETGPEYEARVGKLVTGHPLLQAQRERP